MRRFIIVFACLLLFSCDTSHTSRKIIQNESSHSFQVHYFSSIYDMDSIYTLPQNSYVDIEFFQKLGNHPCELPSSPCSITDTDTLVVLLDNYLFIGDFRDEYRWIEDLSGTRHTIQVCTYVITDDDFE